ncbi:MAG: DnaJ domain-containing protein [Halobacteriaceae archaeon]
MPAPHEVLGVPPDADEEAIVEAYRERVKEVHPDQGGSERAFRAVHEAYERLTGPGDPADGGEGVAVDDRSPGTGTPAAGTARSAARRSGSRSEAGGWHDPTEGTDAAERVTAATVEYLDYDEVAARGWHVWATETFERAAAADLDDATHGSFGVRAGESLLEAAERHDRVWPFACRGGACANCAVALVEGRLSQPVDHILTGELMDRGIRLSCNGYPLTDELRVLFDLQELSALDDLRLPPGPFEVAYPDGTA